MASRGFQEYTPNASRYNKRITNEEWNRLKPRLKELHDRRLTRQQILDIVEPEFGEVKPTYGQLCTKFEKWGFRVYKGKNSIESSSPGFTNLEATPPPPPPPPPAADLYATPPDTSSEHFASTASVPDLSYLALSDGHSTPRPNHGNWSSNPYHLSPGYENVASYQASRDSVQPDSDFTSVYTGSSSSQPFHTPRSYAAHSTPPGAGHAHKTSDVSTVWEEPQQIEINYSSPAYTNNHRVLNIGSDYVPMQSSSSTATTPKPLHVSVQTTSDSSIESDVVRSIHSSQSASKTPSVRTSIEQEDTTASKGQAGAESASIIIAWLKSTSRENTPNSRYVMMANLAAFMYTSRSYSAAFKIYHKLYETLKQDTACDNVCKIGAVIRCAQSALVPPNLAFTQIELHQILQWNMPDSLLKGVVVRTLNQVEQQLGQPSRRYTLSDGEGSLMTARYKHMMRKALTSNSPVAKQLHWRLKLMDHSPFHSGCKRLLQLLFELLTWSWEALNICDLPSSGRDLIGCLCSDPYCTDFVRMITVSLLDAARGLDIPSIVDFKKINETACECTMCNDLQTTFSICPMETFTAVALLTVNECRLRHINHEKGNKHRTQLASVIRKEQLQPTIQFLLGDLYANFNSLTNIVVTDLYDDYLSCLWSCFETHANTGNTQFNPDATALDNLITLLISDEVVRTASNDPTLAPALDLTSGISTPTSLSRSDSAALQRLVLDTKVGAKRTRSNASSLRPSLSTASRASEQSFRETAQRVKRLKYRSSIGQLSALSPANSFSGISPLSSRGSQSRFSYITGYPMELEPMAEGEEPLPPDETPI